MTSTRRSPRTAAGNRKRSPPPLTNRRGAKVANTKKENKTDPRADETPSDHLFELIRLGSWDAAIDRCQSHPQDAGWRHPNAFIEGMNGDNRAPADGIAPIHMAINVGAPADVVRAVLAASPSLIDASITSSRMTPMHMLAKTDLVNGEIERSRILAAFTERFPPSGEELGQLLAPLPLPRDAVGIIASFLPNPALAACRGFYPINLFLIVDEDMNEGCIRALALACPPSLGVCSRPSPSFSGTAIHLAIQAMAGGEVGLDLLEDLVDLADTDALTARLAYTGDTPLHMACRALEAAKLNDAVLTLLWREPSAATVRNSDGRTPLECFLASRTRIEPSINQQIIVNDRSMRVLEELAKACPAVLLEPPGTARPDDWPEGIEWNMYTFLQATMVMNFGAGPHLLSILGDAVERHVGKKMRRLYAIPRRDMFYSLVGGVADLRLPNSRLRALL